MTTLKIPGSTSNLGAGFDTLGLALQLYLTVRARPAAKWQIDVRGEGAGDLPGDGSNLIARAYREACLAFELAEQPYELEVSNEIPLQRGLGSSGAAIVAGLCLARARAPELPLQRLLEIGCALEGHPENVVASMHGGLCVSSFTGGELAKVTLKAIPALAAVLLIPDFPVSTAKARRLLPATVPFADAVHNLQRAALMVAALAGHQPALLRQACRDRLHQPYRASLIPNFEATIEAALAAGAAAAFLSGSGSTMLALVDGPVAPVQNGMERVATAAGYSFASRVVQLDLTGAVVATG